MLQIQDQSLRPLTTAHLAQTMSLLVLSNPELRDRVMTELSSNPALELNEERVCPSCQRKLEAPGPCANCVKRSSADEAVVFLSPREPRRRPTRRVMEEFSSLPEPAAPEDLKEHVLRQLATELEPTERPLALYILSSLDEDGFLVDPAPYIAQATRSSLSTVQHVLELISTADPIGLATDGPRDALLVQLKQLDDGMDVNCELARQILSDHFEELAKKEYEKISHSLDVSVEDIREVAGFIQDNLNPYPGRAYWGSGRGVQMGDPNVYHSPDIMISKSRDEHGHLIVEIFSAFTGNLRINPLFKEACEVSESEKAEEWSQHLERANLFVKCLQQRNNTMRQLMELLVHEQKGFILEGARQLKPMTRAQVAEKIGVHESTVSRAVSSKSVALPDGRIIPLSKFFDRSLSVRDRIREIVTTESTPLTDDQIAGILAEDGIKIARRTVAKYRAIEGILPARLRAQSGNGQTATRA